MPRDHYGVTRYAPLDFWAPPTRRPPAIRRALERVLDWAVATPERRRTCWAMAAINLAAAWVLAHVALVWAGA